jgi:hypothetical protein
MRTTLATLVIAALFTVPGLSQTDKTFYITQTDANLTALVTMIRTVADLQDLTADTEHHAIQAHGPVDRIMLADWILQQLDRPETPGPAGEYKIPGAREEVVRVFHVSRDSSNAALTSLTTAVRTVADLQRLFPYQPGHLLVGRGAPDKMAAAAFVVRQTLPPDGPAPTVDSPAFPAPTTDNKAPDEKSTIRVFRMNPKTTNVELTSVVTAIRTTADVQRLFPMESGMAIIASATPDKVAVAEWLVHEMNKAPDAQAVHEITMPGILDGVVRIFYTGSTSDLTPLATELRTTLGLQRCFPIAPRSAIVLRARPDQIASAQSLVEKFAANAR